MLDFPNYEKCNVVNKKIVNKKIMENCFCPVNISFVVIYLPV